MGIAAIRGGLLRGGLLRGGLLGGRVLAAGTLVAGLVLATGATSPAAGAASSEKPLVIGDLGSCTGPEASTISQTTAVV